MPSAAEPLRLLFLCTGNSARSQIAATTLNRKGPGRWIADSAGARPAARVNPEAIATLERQFAWSGHPPQGLDEVMDQPWNFVITVCDRAKEACPIFPGQPLLAHWGMADPAEVVGTPETIARAFDDAFRLLNRRIDLLLALPVAKLERMALESRVSAIGESEATPAAASPPSGA